MDKDPAQDRQGDREAETAGEEPSGRCRVQTCGNESYHIQGNEQNDAGQCGDLLRGLFFHEDSPFVFRVSDPVSYHSGMLCFISHTLTRFRTGSNERHTEIIKMTNPPISFMM